MTVERALRARTFQVIRLDDGVILKRGEAESRVSGALGVDALRVILSALEQKGSTKRQVLGRFPSNPNIHARVNELIEFLVDRGFLAEEAEPNDTPETESRWDIFFWEHGATLAEVRRRLLANPVVVCGVNALGASIAAKLVREGFHLAAVADDRYLRNLDFYDSDEHVTPRSWDKSLPQPTPLGSLKATIPDGPTLLVAACDCGSPQYLRKINELAVVESWRLIPVVLDGSRALLGPLVVPGEGPCYECVRARENANLDRPEVQRAIERVAFEGQAVRSLFRPYLELVAEQTVVLAYQAILGIPSPAYAPSLLEWDLSRQETSRHRVLRLPLCRTCSTLGTVPPVRIHR